MAVFVLIHGAWMGSWIWEDIKARLTKHGHKVITPDLPIDSVRITFNQYIEILTNIIQKQNEKVILVGHSMSGIIVSTLGELIPNKIHLLVYLSAFLPINGESMLDIIRKFQGSNQIEIELFANNFLCMVKKNFVEQRFFNCCSQKYIIYAQSLMRLQSTKVFYEKVKLSKGNFYLIKKAYIKCTQDNAITMNTQNKMIERQMIEHIYSLKTDHCPFFSNILELSEILLSFTKTNLTC